MVLVTMVHDSLSWNKVEVGPLANPHFFWRGPVISRLIRVPARILAPNGIAVACGVVWYLSLT